MFKSIDLPADCEIRSVTLFLTAKNGDKDRVLLVEFMQQGATANAAANCPTQTKLRRAMQNKRLGLLTAGVLLLRDNARPHSAIRTPNLITSFVWEQIDRPP